MARDEACAAVDVEALREHRAERRRLHRPEATARRSARRSSRPALGPHALGVAAVIARRASRRAPGRALPCSRESGARRAARGRPPRGRRGPSARSPPRRARRAAPSASAVLGRGRHGHLLVEREADQERERLLGDQPVGVVVAGEMEPLRVHGASLRVGGRYDRADQRRDQQDGRGAGRGDARPAAVRRGDYRAARGRLAVAVAFVVYLIAR